jgi:predicted nucleic acid-binding protein
MASRVEPYLLVDTNVLVYAYDRSEPEKQKRAFGLLNQLHRAGAGALSTQVLGEFFHVLTRKLSVPFPPEVARERVERYLVSWPVLSLTPLVVQEAVRGAVEHQMSYYDAQVWAVARLNQLQIILSEDFPDGSIIDGVRFVNPFAEGFDLDQL